LSLCADHGTGPCKEIASGWYTDLQHHQREQVKRFNVEAIEMKDWKDSTPIHFEGPVYISLDLDALDPAFAPGFRITNPEDFLRVNSYQLFKILKWIS
jgi:arginase family enzyme